MKLLNIVKFRSLSFVWMPGETFSDFSILFQRMLDDNTLYLGVTNGIIGYIEPIDTKGYTGQGYYK